MRSTCFSRYQRIDVVNYISHGVRKDGQEEPVDSESSETAEGDEERQHSP